MTRPGKLFHAPRIVWHSEPTRPSDIHCDLCGQHYDFDKVDCAQLFASDAPVEVPAPASNVEHRAAFTQFLADCPATPCCGRCQISDWRRRL